MPNSKTPNSPARTASFRHRYDELELRRVALMERLTSLGAKAAAHPAHGRARTLLSTTFRKAKLVQRAAILEAAEWLIAVLDRTTMLL